MKAPVATIVGLVLVLTPSCRKRPPPYAPIGANCSAGHLADGVILETVSGSGFEGRAWTRAVYVDGHVIETSQPGSVAPVSFTIPVERLRKLDADLTATGVFETPEGCWREETPEPELYPDTLRLPNDLIVRHAGRIYTYKGPGELPPIVQRARKVVAAFDIELGAAKRDAGSTTP